MDQQRRAMEHVKELLTPTDEGVDPQFDLVSRKRLDHQHVQIETCEMNKTKRRPFIAPFIGQNTCHTLDPNQPASFRQSVTKRTTSGWYAAPQVPPGGLEFNSGRADEMDRPLKT